MFSDDGVAAAVGSLAQAQDKITLVPLFASTVGCSGFCGFAIVGNGVGTAVGDGVVGEAVGRAVGRDVGRDVGRAVGRDVGRDVGRAVGSAVGRAVGRTVGRAAVGDSVSVLHEVAL